MRTARLALATWACILAGITATLSGEQPPSATPDSTATKEPVWTEAQRRHWSFLPPRRPAVPSVHRASWVRTPIDAFIIHDVENLGLEPAAEADRISLIRRLRFDLTGLPPTPEEVDAFVNDPRPDAYEQLVERLLASEQYGERWARMWLDLARYAESDGFKSDKTRPSAWRYRDWVIRALNDDLPYDQFVRLQLAGDEINPGDHKAFIATGFNRNWPFEDNNKVPGLNRQLMLDDMTDTTASVFLGLTVACARCHDHKYDPISQKDYYRFQALFGSTAPKDDLPLADSFDVAVQDFLTKAHMERVAALKRDVDAIERPYLTTLLKDKLASLPADVRKALQTDPEKRSAFQEDLLLKHAKAMTVDPAKMRSAMPPETRPIWESRVRLMETAAKQAPPSLPVASGMVNSPHEESPVRLLRKGNFKNPGEVIPPGFLSVLSASDGTARDPSPPAESPSRQALATWLTRPEHPLTARVIVNRLWQIHFGRGIVTTPSDFGTQGTEPSHPELLDWLATELVARGWSLKAMHRLMVTSATYRQSSVPSAKTRDEDPDNQLFSRMTRRRLEGEAVRDAMLTASGELDPRIGGPSVFPDLPQGIQTRGGWDRSTSVADRNRRSVYVFVRRNLKYPLFDAFDAPDSNVTCPERNISVNAPQALMLLNSDLVVSHAQAFAGRILGEASDPHDLASLVRRAYRVALAREPSAEECARGVAFLNDDTALTSPVEGPAKANSLPKPMRDGFDPAQGAALVDFCHALLNLNEFVFVD
jgi:hypothetical protein